MLGHGTCIGRRMVTSPGYSRLRTPRDPNDIFASDRPMTVDIVKATPADISRIRDFALPVFTETYKTILTPSQNAYMLDMAYSVEQLKKDMDRGVEYYLLTVDGKDAGFTSIELVDHATQSFKLHKIYLQHDMHGKGLGKMQLQKMEHIAKSRGGKRIKLNVNRDNDKAIGFYKSQGWAIIRQEDNDIGEGYYMNDYVLEKVFE